MSQYKDIFQYVYSNVFPEIYCSTKRRGFNLKNIFHITFLTYKDKKIIESLGQNPQNYENVPDETNLYEQKPIKVNNFNEDEEKELKGRIEKRKIKRREAAKKKKQTIEKNPKNLKILENIMKIKK